MKKTYLATACSVCLVVACNGRRDQNKAAIRGYPELMREQMGLADFVRLEETDDEILLVYDNNHDSKPDTWIVWKRSPQLHEFGGRSDSNFDGKIDRWLYWGQDLTQEIDTDFDGNIDKWCYKSGKRAFDTDGDGEPDKETHNPRIKPDAATPTDGDGRKTE